MVSRHILQRRFRVYWPAAILASIAALAGCQGSAEEEEEEDVLASRQAMSSSRQEGKRLFEKETFDPVLMYDGRAPDLAAQALDAVHGHALRWGRPSTRTAHGRGCVRSATPARS